jgi:hypothetical protein
MCLIFNANIVEFFSIINKRQLDLCNKIKMFFSFMHTLLIAWFKRSSNFEIVNMEKKTFTV